MHRLSFTALLATALCGVAAPSALASLPLETVPTGAGTSPRDVVSAGRHTFFTQYSSKIGRVSESGTVTQFPSGFDSTSRLTVGPEGTIWFLGANGQTGSKTVGRMTQDGQLLSQSAAMKSWGTGLTTGADGFVYVAEAGWVAKFAPNGSLVAEYHVNEGNGGFANDVTAGPDGNIWIAESTLPGATAIGRLTPAGNLTTFTGFIGPKCTPGSKPVTCINTEHLAVGPNGNLWYTASKVYDGDVGSIGTITTGGFAADQLLPGGAQPTEIVGGRSADVYVLSAEAHTLLRFDLLGHVTDTTPLGTYPVGLEYGADGSLWVGMPSESALKRITPEARPTTGNLIVDGDGETTLRTSIPAATVPLTGWATSPGFTATSLNPAAGGGALWGGPSNASSYARQLIDVRGESAEIDAGNRVVTLAGQIGGYGGQADHGVISARYLDDDGQVLDDLETAPVTAEDLGGQTGYAARSVKELLPKGTRRIEVQLLASRVDGSSNDVFFDDVSLTLAALPVPEPGLGAPKPGPPSAPKPKPSTGNTPGAGNGQPGTPASEQLTAGATLTAPKLSATSFTPLGSGGPYTTDPSATGGLLVSFTLSAPARITVRVDRASAGRKKGRRCVAKAKAKRGARACTRYVTKGSFTVDRPAGASSVRLTGRLNGKRLPAGRYRLVLTPAGGRSTTLAVRIR